MRDPEAKEYRIPCKGCDGGQCLGSECCGGELIDGICMDCKEHAELEVCPRCDGLGYLLADRMEFDDYHNGGCSE